ncbi:MAG: leucine-rich repeat protein, partial [Holosporales bacterium]|nr:leucine-rich repeat protein [Holosporales bacterium]
MQQYLSKFLFGQSICFKHTFYALASAIISSSYSAFATTTLKASLDIAKSAMDSTASIIRFGPQNSTNFTEAVAENVDAVKKFLDDMFVSVQRTMIPLTLALEYSGYHSTFPEFFDFLIETGQTVESLRAQPNTLVLLNENSMPSTSTLANIEHLYLVLNYPKFDITACTNLKTIAFFDGPALSIDQRTQLSTLVKTYKQLQNLIAMNWGDSTIAAEAFCGTDTDHPGSLVNVIIHKATVIQPNAFRYCCNLTAVSIPDAVTIDATIDKNDESGAFQYCISLAIASFPVVTSIGHDAFAYCSSLTTTSFPIVQTINDRAFQYTGVTTASFAAAQTIWERAFYSCKSLQTASFPAAKIIRGGAFEQCTALT